MGPVGQQWQRQRGCQFGSCAVEGVAMGTCGGTQRPCAVRAASLAESEFISPLKVVINPSGINITNVFMNYN